MTINNLLLKQSKGTMLEGLAQSFVRQPFQDLNSVPLTLNSKPTSLFLFWALAQKQKENKKWLKNTVKR